jgi:hypothetical protein
MSCGGDAARAERLDAPGVRLNQLTARARKNPPYQKDLQIAYFSRTAFVAGLSEFLELSRLVTRDFPAATVDAPASVSPPSRHPSQGFSENGG